MPRRRARPVYVFRAKLVGLSGVRRRVALRGDQTLSDLHLALQDAFGWDDSHLYAFWLDGTYWSHHAVEYAHPDHARELRSDPMTHTARVRLGDLGLAPGQKVAYSFDFDDEWRVELTVAGIEADDEGVYPRLLESSGKAPAQYLDFREDVA
jgi:hypothetical protein